MNKLRYILFLFLFLLAPSADADCPLQTKCENGSCERLAIPSCNEPNHVTVISAGDRTSIDDVQDTNQNTSTTVLKNSTTTQQSANDNAHVRHCAENNSCYGDLSSVTGAPKTTHVHGYYRKNGTYVRGHYRSRR